MIELKPCPCGKTPKGLHVVTNTSGKWAQVCGDCCNEWSIEYRNGYAEGKEQYVLAVEAWNESPRDTRDNNAMLDEVIGVASRYIYKDTIADASALTDEEQRNNLRFQHLIKVIENLKEKSGV